MRNGVVGRIGKNTPIIPKAKLIQASGNKISFTDESYHDPEQAYLESINPWPM